MGGKRIIVVGIPPKITEGNITGTVIAATV